MSTLLGIISLTSLLGLLVVCVMFWRQATVIRDKPRLRQYQHVDWEQAMAKYNERRGL